MTYTIYITFDPDNKEKALKAAKKLKDYTLKEFEDYIKCEKKI